MSATGNHVVNQNIPAHAIGGNGDLLYPDVPTVLKALPNWICYRSEQNHGKRGNVPYQISGTHAQVNDSSTWSSFEDAAGASTNPARKFNGISFVLTGTPYLGFDFDNVITDGQLDPYVAAILKLLDDPYSEISPSETGLRTFVECRDLPRPKKTIFTNEGYGVELYHGRWAGKALTITGTRCSGTGVTSIDAQRFELVHLLCSQICNAKFKSLWLGDLTKYGGDDSRADLALCCLLAHLLGSDAKKIDAAFRFSKLYREKWNRADYSKNTIAKAIESAKVQVATPSKNQLVFRLPAVVTTEANFTEYVLAKLPDQPDGTDGWFPLGAVSLVGAPSGASKTTMMYQLLLAQACMGNFLGHASYGFPFCVMGDDRGEAAHYRTMKRMRLRPDTIPFEHLSLVWDSDMVQQIIEKLESEPQCQRCCSSKVLT